MNAAALQRHGYSVAAVRALARKRLPRMLFDMVDGAAGDEITMRRNEDPLILETGEQTNWGGTGEREDRGRAANGHQSKQNLPHARTK